MDAKNKLCVLLPTMSRPDGLIDAVKSYEKNSCQYSDLKFGLSCMDSELQNNINTIIDLGYNLDDDVYIYGDVGMCRTVNLMAKEDFPGYGAYMVLNDDQIIHTKEFDKLIMKTLDDLERESEHRIWILHWKDGINDEKLCQSFATKEFLEITDTYYPDGFMRHLYSDNMYQFIGENCGILHYMPEIYIEHNHPCVGKAAFDETYQRTNSKKLYSRDGVMYAEWLNRMALPLCKKIHEKINKPFNEEEIVAKIKELIQQKEEPALQTVPQAL